VLFNTVAYAGFFAGVFVFAWLMRPWPKARLGFLLGASYFFYAQWDYRFLPLIWLSSSIDFWLARRIAAAPDPGRRKLWLVVTVVMNLGVLGFFKYAQFGLDQWRALAELWGQKLPAHTLSIALPVGISFFTFESMSYVVDVYRKELEPHDSYLEYLTFVAFFPHLVAGPIVRPKDLLPQLQKAPAWDGATASGALFLILIGLSKKIVIGDYLATNLIDRVFGNPAFYSSLEAYAAAVGYSLQIYCDFSGYTDIAAGSALLLGVRFPQNFDSPYQSTNITEFWRRWHISLSTWLRDYLYIPLGGNRRGTARTYGNLLITMVLGGLWHGAAWTFVAWGALHGLALAFHRAWSQFFPSRAEPSLLRRSLGMFVTFHVVLVGWIFFRAPTFGSAAAFGQQLTAGTWHAPNLSLPLLGVLGLGIVTHLVPKRWLDRAQERYASAPWLAQGALLFLGLWVLRRMSQAEAVPFVYFQF
jgi:alginate O-acetyltransferase complex protein AlgI